MIEQIEIYLWSISENVRTLIGMIGIILLMGSPFTLALADTDYYKHDVKNVIPLFKKVLISGLLLLMFSLLIPIKKDLALIFLYPHIKNGTETVVKSETMNKMKQLTNLYLDKQIKDLKENK